MCEVKLLNVEKVSQGENMQNVAKFFAAYWNKFMQKYKDGIELDFDPEKCDWFLEDFYMMAACAEVMQMLTNDNEIGKEIEAEIGLEMPWTQLFNTELLHELGTSKVN